MINNTINKNRDSLKGKTDHCGFKPAHGSLHRSSVLMEHRSFLWLWLLLAWCNTDSLRCCCCPHLPDILLDFSMKNGSKGKFFHQLQVIRLCCTSNRWQSYCIQSVGSRFAVSSQNWVVLLDLGVFFAVESLILTRGKSVRVSHFVTYTDIKV